MTAYNTAIALEPAEASIAWNPENGQIPLRDGRLIDVTGPEWIIQTPRNRLAVLWRNLFVPDGDVLNSIRRWVAHNLRTKSPDAAVAGFSQALPFFNSDAFLAAAYAPDTVPYLAFSEAQTTLGEHQRWQLHYPRAFYRWCVAQRFPHFDPEVARKLDGIIIGGNSKGAAVRSADPEKGPLDAMEVAALALALRAARIEGTMPLDEQAAVWLCLAFGANASQYAMMREEDIAPQFVEEQLATTLVQVPRHKKKHVGPRTEFQTRKANRFVGRILQDLVTENNDLHKPNDADVARPLFWRKDPLDRGEGMEQWLWHLRGKEFTALVQRAVKRLRVLSRIGDKYTDTDDWMGDGAMTPLLARSHVATHRKRELPNGLPWLSGYSNLNSVFVEAVELDEKLAVLWRPQDSTGFEVRLPPDILPHTLVTAAPGRPFRQYVSHPLLDRFELVIQTVRLHQKSLRLKLRGGLPLWRRVRLKGGDEERREMKDHVRALRDGRRHLEKVIAGHLTLPGQRGDAEVPWDDILDEDEIDGFTGRPWPELDRNFEGISSRRHHEERLHDDGDPPIRFDEDDPASYD